MQSNRIVVILGGDGTSGLAVSYGRNINTMYLNSHLANEFVVRPNFLLGAAETMWVTFTQGDVKTKALMLMQRKTTKANSTMQVVGGTESMIEQIPDSGYEYYMTMPDVVLKNVGEWKFSLTISELPVDVNYKGTVATDDDLPDNGELGDTYWVSGASEYYYWNGTAWAVLDIEAIYTSDVGTFTVNESVSGDIGGTATDLDIQVMYNFVLDVIGNLSNYLPKIGDNGNWYVWDSESGEYVDSGKPSNGTEFFQVLELRYTEGTSVNNTDYQRAMLSPTGKVARVGDFVISKYTVDYSVTPPAQTLRSSIGQIKSIASTGVLTAGWVGYVTGEQGEKGADGQEGAQGPQGEQGPQGPKGDNGVGIASVVSAKVDGGTKVTITLTNGQTSSFIVSDGDVSNVTALEFPYGEPVVTYDTTDGLHVHADLRVTVNGVTNDIPLDLEIPQIAGDGLTEDVDSTNTKAIVKVDGTVLRTTGNQSVSGNFTVGGNLTVKGKTTTVDAETLKVDKKLIVVADGNTVALTSPAGIMAPKYDGINSGALVFDSTGTAYVGDVVLTADGNDIDVEKSDLQPLATRGELVNGNVVKWNATTFRLEDTGVKATDLATKSEVSAASGLLYTLNYESASVPTVGQVLTLTNASFTHTPVVGDKFTIVELVNTKDTYINNMEILTVGATTCTAKITSFTDVTSGKLDKATNATADDMVYVKKADGTQALYSVTQWISNYEEITYAALKAKRDGATLVKGKWYRITDYNCTTTQANSQSAGHVFDIIVRADDTNVLNENAYAALHSGDTYFANCKLEAWQLKYCLDNDTERFAWADSTNGKGVIYYMKDEWDNECPYDFKNIQFKRYKITASTKVPDLVGAWGMNNVQNYTVSTTDTQFFYTFSYFDDVASPNVMYDATLKGNDGTLLNDGSTVSGVYGNVIKETSAYIMGLAESDKPMKIGLTNVVIYGTETYRASDAYYGCYSNTFGNDCYYNTFGNGCYYNTFGNGCDSNTFGNDCFSNTFGNGCFSNTFGNYCYYNTFGNYCYYNTFGNGCDSNTFGNRVYSGDMTAVNLQTCFVKDGVGYIKFTASTGQIVQYVTVESGIVGASSSNKLELFDTDLVNKTYPITITRESGTNGKYLMKWNINGACETGKYKATATAASWTPFTADMQSTSKGYVDTQVGNIDTVLTQLNNGTGV